MDPEDARPQIIFGLVTRGPEIVLAEYAGLTGNFEEATRKFIQNIKPGNAQEDWKSYTCGEQAFHYIIDGELWYVCMADRTMERRLPFGFLSALKDLFDERFKKEVWSKAGAFSLNDQFRDDIAVLMEKYNSPDADRVASMTAKVRQIEDGLMDSIDKLMDRQEKIELLVNRSQVLSESSSSFNRESTRLHRTIRWRNLKTHLILGGIAILVIIILVWVCTR